MNKKSYSEMNIDNADEICRKIKEEADYQIKTVLSDAQNTRKKILEDAKCEAENKRTNILKNLDMELEGIQKKVLSSLNLEKKRMHLDEKDKLVKSILERVKKMSEEFRDNPEYKNFLEKAIQEGAAVINHKDIDIFYSFQDERIIKGDFMHNITNVCRDKFKNDFSFQFKKSDFQDIGVIMQSRDARLIYDNRFLSRLKRMYDDVYISLLKGLL